jgi:hypothetical protein
MPLYNWSVTFIGEGVEAANEDVLKKTLSNQTSISANAAGSLKTVRVEVEPASGIIAPPAGAIPDLRKH